ncbi:MAG: hypothetical protein QGH93_00490 [Gammaproteobacteria bacterium]|nr:hypothetical protein [Gammaproteobacteria bacterium]
MRSLSLLIFVICSMVTNAVAADLINDQKGSRYRARIGNNEYITLESDRSSDSFVIIQDDQRLGWIGFTPQKVGLVYWLVNLSDTSLQYSVGLNDTVEKRNVHTLAPQEAAKAGLLDSQPVDIENIFIKVEAAD